jgi:transcription initiation factor TFIIIB Brf1 subunit/transcription initiation factor TFIIB
MWMTNYCPECGGEMSYDLNVKLYTCKSCGLTLSYQELLEAKNRNIQNFEDEHKRERKEYLKWWLSKKES